MYKHGILIAGITAGIINGLFGAGGGTVLVPLLTLLTDLDDATVFPSSVAIILPICIASIFFSFRINLIDFNKLLYYLAGASLGGVLAGTLGKRIPTFLLHKILGILILWGGIRYLC